MRRLSVDFAPRKSGAARILPLWIIGLCSLAVWFGLMGWRERERGLELDRQALAMARQINELESVATPQRESTDVPPYFADAEAVAKMAAFPTQKLLRSLETVQMTGIKINQIELQADGGIAEVNLEFMSYETLMAYVEQLNDNEPDGRWKLVRAGSQGSGRGSQAVIRWR